MKLIITLLITLLVFCNLFAQKKESLNKNYIYVGAIETKLNSWFLYESKTEGDSTPIKIIRPLFYKSERGWFSLEKKIEDAKLYPLGRKWHIAFDNKNLGTFQSIRSPIRYMGNPWSYPRDSYHLIVDNNIPTIGKTSFEFSGFEYEKQYSPLIGISHLFCNDPENWKSFIPDTTDLHKLFVIYKYYFNNRDFKADKLKIKQLIFMKSYQSNNKNQLIQLAVKSNENINYPLWIYKSHTGALINSSKIIDFEFSEDDFTDDDISTNTLIEAGDFDNDGKSEIIFWSSRYNGDGYVMFYDNFTKMIDFTWSYH